MYTIYYADADRAPEGAQQKLPNALYHVTSRGDRREAIFEDNDDRVMFLEILGVVGADHNWLCHGHRLMDNHYHLIIETLDGNLSKAMRQLNGVHTQASNRRHGLRRSSFSRAVQSNPGG
ncbi:transposase [Nitrosomonas sp.]|uniref:transposase n=1 Tax=Nitrosomonas sp. TaxID=42353 RepID=UPI00374D7285